jgi:hypothetical protein
MNSENNQLCEPVPTIPRKSQRGLNFASRLGFIEDEQGVGCGVWGRS